MGGVIAEPNEGSIHDSRVYVKWPDTRLFLHVNDVARQRPLRDRMAVRTLHQVEVQVSEPCRVLAVDRHGSIALRTGELQHNHHTLEVCRIYRRRRPRRTAARCCASSYVVLEQREDELAQRPAFELRP